MERCRDGQGIAINCFQCNTAEDRECDSVTVNDTDSKFYKNCTGDYEGKVPFCRKVSTRVLSVENSERVLRSCGWILSSEAKRDDDCKKGDTDFILRWSCMCFSDACNAAKTVHSSTTATVVAVAALTLLYNSLWKS
ncbi:hypothetical protein NQ318_002144 [Aromia moschata]|uniref:Protein sleepless n=1 Tax=Aromia moschata TaxID=1265417 RepID=A0AAV8Y1B1_9CUCU|nr:hypothetical protein NQ318_002144 [Aromia moschata]